MSKCKYLKIKMSSKLECKLTHKIINIRECNNCKFKEYLIKSKSTKLKSKTYKLTKSEKNRFSILTNDLDHCIICGKSPVNKHEIFYGSKHRQLSIKYGLVIPLCTVEHHNQYKSKGIHFNKELDLLYKRKGQQAFVTCYPELNFIDIFKKNYL